MSYIVRRKNRNGGAPPGRSDVGGIRARGGPQARSKLGRSAGGARKVKGGAMRARLHVQQKSNGSMDRFRKRQVDEGATITINRRGVVTRMTENAITITQLQQLVTDRRVDYCLAFQQADGWFTVRAKLSRERDVRYLATFREVGKPRRFSRLDVLFKLLHDTLGYNGVIQVLPYSRTGAAKRLGAH
jgi:hypothetical protein